MSSRKQSRKKFSALIVGLGNIGFGYDADKPKYVFTHSQAFLRDKAIDLIAGIDPAPSRRMAFSKKTRIRAYKGVDEFRKIETRKIDIVSICTPTAIHHLSVKECLKLNPKVIILEKPISTDIKEAREIVRLCRNRGVSLYVNYWRRVDPFFRTLQKKIKGKRLGKLLFGVIHYSGGLHNNASHFIDMLNFWLGDSFQKVEYHSNGNFVLMYGGRQFQFHTSNEFNYALTECDLLFSKGRIRCLDSDLSYEALKSKKNPYFKNYYTLQKTEARPIPSLLKYQAFVLRHVIDHLRGKTKLHSTGESALKTLEIIEKIKRR